MSEGEDQKPQRAKVGDYFAIVMRVERENPQRRFSVASVKHQTYNDARAEAARLAEQHPGATFAALEVKSVHRSKALRRRAPRGSRS